MSHLRMVLVNDDDAPVSVLMDRCTWFIERLDATDYEDKEVRQLVPLGTANIVSSHIKAFDPFRASHTHRPVLDLDRPYTAQDALQIDYLFAEYSLKPSELVEVVPSTTEGHCHLYLQFMVPERQYMRILMYLAVFGLIETGYATASIARGGTFVRLPGVKKEVPA